MKVRHRFIALFAAAFILAGSFPVTMVRAGQDGEPAGGQEVRAETIEEAPTGQETTKMFGEEPAGQEITKIFGEELTGQETEVTSGEETAEQKGMEESGEEPTGEEPTEWKNAEASREEPTEQGSAEVFGEEPAEEEPTEWKDAEESGEKPAGQNTVETTGEEKNEQENSQTSREEKTEQENSQTTGEDTETVSEKLTESLVEDEAVDMSQQGTVMEEETDYPVPDEPPAFHAHIENWMGYTVIGTFMDFTPDIVQIDTLYSLDGESWRAVTGGNWNLYGLGTEDKDKLHTLQNQPCIYNAYEPMKSYTTGDIDRFYLKLRITKKNGLSYESQSVTIERGGIQPIPEGTTRYACFSSGMIVRESVPDSPYRYRMYGRYQLTVSADATAEDISALLPDTFPVEIQLIHGRDFRVNGIVDCPVTWKPLALPQLSPGETITIPDAAGEIIVPAGTRLSTPLGVFELDEPIGVDAPPMTDEVRLILNVSPEDRALAGVLKQSPDGLTVALRQKPTGAANIEAYVLTEGASKWTELPGRSLLSQMNAQHASENSGFALVLYNDEKPFCSYLEAKKAGTEPTPFFVGLKIEGGIYDGRQLILAWPDIYEELPDLPEVGRSEGNEGNAGAANKDDSTEGGQRPNLPQPPADDTQGKEEQKPSADDAQGKGEQKPSADDAQGKEEQKPPADNGQGKEEQKPSADNGQGKGEQSPADNGQGKEEQSSADDAQGKEEQSPADNGQGKVERPPIGDAQGKGEQSSADNGQGKEEQSSADNGQGKEKQPPIGDGQGKGEQQSPADDTRQEGNQSPADDIQGKEEQSPVDDMQKKGEQQSPSPADSMQEKGEQKPPADDMRQEEQPPRADASETADAVPKDQTEHAAGETFPDSQETGQRPNLQQILAETADAPAANPENAPALGPLVVQAAANIEEKENISDVSVPQTAIEPVTATKQGSRALLLTATASTVAAGGCIGAVVLKLTGHGLFHQIAKTIRKIFRIRR